MNKAPRPTGRFHRNFWNLLLPIALMAVLSHCRPGPDTAAFQAAKLVDPQIGSVHGRWFFYTPAALPFGMAKLAPHTNAYGCPSAAGAPVVTTTATAPSRASGTSTNSRSAAWCSCPRPAR
jgi:hypothetical protein